MAIVFTYTESTNIVVQTGGTSGTPANCDDFVHADRTVATTACTIASGAELRAATAVGNPTDVTLTYPMRPVEEKALRLAITTAQAGGAVVSGDETVDICGAASSYYNLTMYSIGGDAIELQANSNVKNVIFDLITGSDINENGGSATTATNYADSDGNPLFTDAASGDFTLQSGSPARDAGTDLGATYDDALDPISTWPDNVLTLDQDLYGSGWEIGAYVFSRTRPRRRIGKQE